MTTPEPFSPFAGFVIIGGLVATTLRLLGVVEWSWVVVTFPLWAPLVLAVVGVWVWWLATNIDCAVRWTIGRFTK